MLNENLKAIRKAKGLSQEELAVKVNVVRQTISKWEQGLSVSTLLGEPVTEVESKPDDLKAIAEKLEVINLQLAQRKNARRKAIHGILIILCAGIAAVFAALMAWDSPYLNWDYSDPETAVTGVVLHILEWLFVRIAPLIFIAAAVGVFLTRKRA